MTVNYEVQSDYTPHEKQKAIHTEGYTRKIGICGRQSGKSAGVGAYISDKAGEGYDVAYFAPTAEQTASAMRVVKSRYQPLIDEKIVTYNRSTNFLDIPGGGSVKAQTAWHPDNARGGTYDIVVLDEAFLMHPTMYDEVALPMVAVRGGEIIIISTPPSPVKQNKNPDYRWLIDLWKRTENDDRWLNFSWTTRDNPYITDEAYADLIADMSSMAIEIELNARIIDDPPTSIYTREMIEAVEYTEELDYEKLILVIDPAGSVSATSDETGIVEIGQQDKVAYVSKDYSGRLTPNQIVSVILQSEAPVILIEEDYGKMWLRGLMKAAGIEDEKRVQYIKSGTTAKAKFKRINQCVGLFENKRVRFNKTLTVLKEQMIHWTGERSKSVENILMHDDRIDAMAYGLQHLLLGRRVRAVARKV